MSAVVGILFWVGLIGAYFAYAKWLENGIKPRTFRTALATEQLRALFQDKVACAGWKIVDDGNPMIAQSSLVTGIRQQISLRIAPATDGGVTVRVGPERWVTKRGMPKKAHTLRLRMNSFVAAAQARDSSISISQVSN